ncbi:MAG: hypothetical protein HY917_05245 [Candidatus Diapherotrites archaeon]|nr:hypothetical protein [Candidatus Diapherotrites archaeon]
MDESNSLRQRLLGLAHQQVQAAHTASDSHIIKAVNLSDDLDTIINLLTEQVREWESLHFPEFNQLIKEHEPFLKLLTQLGERRQFTQTNIEKTIPGLAKTSELANAAQASAGKEASASEQNQIQSLARNVLALQEQRTQLTQFIENQMNERWPHFSELAGPIVAARILSKLGSGKKMAFCTSSTLQVIGAQKALFAHLRQKAPSPKHGFIYAHPSVNGAPPEERGKAARHLAGKLAIAAKQDFFSRASKQEIAEPIPMAPPKRTFTDSPAPAFKREEKPFSKPPRESKPYEPSRPVRSDNYPRKPFDSPRPYPERRPYSSNYSDRGPPQRPYPDRESPRPYHSRPQGDRPFRPAGDRPYRKNLDSARPYERRPFRPPQEGPDRPVRKKFESPRPFRPGPEGEQRPFRSGPRPFPSDRPSFRGNRDYHNRSFRDEARVKKNSDRPEGKPRGPKNSDEPPFKRPFKKFKK